MADRYDPIPDLAALLAASVHEAAIPSAYRLAVKLRITPESGAKAVEAKLREALGIGDPNAAPAGADELRVGIHAHLRLHPNLTAYEIARGLGLPNPKEGGQSRVRRQLVRMEAEGEAEKTVGPKCEGDQRPTARWRAT